MSAIYSIIPAAHAPTLNAFFEAFGWGTGTYAQPLTTESPATLNSAVTHFHNYNASAAAGDFSLFSSAKAGTLPVNDINDDPIPYGVGGIVTEAAVLEAFSHLELWANDSNRDSGDFAAEQAAGIGVEVLPPDL